MKKQLFLSLLSFLILCLLSACGDDSPNDVLKKALDKDNCVDKTEFQTLATVLRKDRRGRSEYGKDDAVWEFITEGGGKSCDGTANGEPTSETPNNTGNALKKPVYNVFIENSGSMDGYVKGNSEFKNAVYGFLSDVLMKTNGITEKMNLYYINSKVLPFDAPLEDFIEKLNPTAFQKRGGERGTTDLYEVVKRSVDSINDQKTVVFVSDCVFSPGKGRNALDYLASQKTGFKRVFSDLLYTHADLATVVIKLKSNFDGAYYDFNNKAIVLKDKKRPYYIWLIGKHSHIETLLSKVKIDNIEGGVEDFHAFYPLSISTQPKYQIIKNEAIGRFNIDRDNPNTITDAETGDRGSNSGFRFGIGIDLKKTGVSESYLSDTANYKISSDKYKIEVKPITDEEKTQNKALANYSHKLLLSTKDLKPQTLDIEFKRKLPQWIYNTDSKDDQIQDETELTKTFGFRYMVEGVSDAFQSVAKEQNAFFKIKVIIKK